MTQRTLERETAFSCQNEGCNSYSTLQHYIRADNAKAELGGAQEFLPEGVSITPTEPSVPYECQGCPMGQIQDILSQGVENLVRENGTTLFTFGNRQYELGPKGIRAVGSNNGFIKVQGSEGRIDVEETISYIG